MQPCGLPLLKTFIERFIPHSLPDKLQQLLPLLKQHKAIAAFPESLVSSLDALLKTVSVNLEKVNQGRGDEVDTLALKRELISTLNSVKSHVKNLPSEKVKELGDTSLILQQSCNLAYSIATTR